MTQQASELSTDQGTPAVAAAPIGEAKSSGLPQEAADTEATPASQRPRPLRIGDKVRSLVDDVCVTKGLKGLVVNVAPPRYGAPARARILWDNETVSMADATTFEVITDKGQSSPSAEPQEA